MLTWTQQLSDHLVRVDEYLIIWYDYYTRTNIPTEFSILQTAQLEVFSQVIHFGRKHFWGISNQHIRLRKTFSFPKIFIGCTEVSWRKIITSWFSSPLWAFFNVNEASLDLYFTTLSPQGKLPPADSDPTKDWNCVRNRGNTAVSLQQTAIRDGLGLCGGTWQQSTGDSDWSPWVQLGW